MKGDRAGTDRPGQFVTKEMGQFVMKGDRAGTDRQG